jgi:hypothetical protein
MRRAVITLAVGAVAALMALPAFAANGGTDRPYKNSGNQIGWFNFTNNSYYIVGPFIASHLGEGSVITSNPTGKIGDEVDIYTAANGDTLNAKGRQDNLPTNGVVCPEVPGFFNAGPFSQHVDYSGGTGRFANAKGTTVAVGCLYFGAPISPGVYTFYATFSETGTLSY